MKLKLVLAVVFALLLTAAAAHAYEFHLLNGMVIKGDLRGFKDGLFTVAADFGTVIIEADKLDYIIINEGDGKAKGENAPGVAVDGPGNEFQGGPEPVAPDAAPTAPAPPRPLGDMSIPPPKPLGDKSIQPRPLKGFSLGKPGALDYTPGTFTGGRKRQN